MKIDKLQVLHLMCKVELCRPRGKSVLSCRNRSFRFTVDHLKNEERTLTLEIQIHKKLQRQHTGKRVVGT